jgi:hypothetical protein
MVRTSMMFRSPVLEYRTSCTAAVHATQHLRVCDSAEDSRQVPVWSIYTTYEVLVIGRAISRPARVPVGGRKPHIAS